MNDIENNNVPAFEMQLSIEELKKSSGSLLFKGCLGINFNSLISHTWEPIIEPFWFIVVQNKNQGENTLTFSLDITRTKELNINITEEFVIFLIIYYQ